MSQSQEGMFLLLVILQIKHLLADYGLQFGFMLRGRKHFFHAGRLAHVTIHATGSAMVLFVLGTQAGLLQVLVAAESAAHEASRFVLRSTRRRSPRG